MDYIKLLDISQYPNVYMKLSAFADESRQDPPYEKLKPLIRELVQRFTTRRLVWGSAYRSGMGSGAYAALVQRAMWLLDFLSIEELRQIFVENPRRLYKL